MICFFSFSVSCPSLVAPPSGNVTISTDGATSSAIYTCAAGYELSGDSVQECLNNGTWSSVQPSCCMSYSYISLLFYEMMKLSKLNIMYKSYIRICWYCELSLNTYTS